MRRPLRESRRLPATAHRTLVKTNERRRRTPIRAAVFSVRPIAATNSPFRDLFSSRARNFGRPGLIRLPAPSPRPIRLSDDGRGPGLRRRAGRRIFPDIRTIAVNEFDICAAFERRLERPHVQQPPSLWRFCNVDLLRPGAHSGRCPTKLADYRCRRRSAHDRRRPRISCSGSRCV